jgi:hypothetical protein
MARTGRVAMSRGTGAPTPIVDSLEVPDADVAFDTGVSFSV